MKAEIIAINSHLLRGQVVNENACFLAQELTPLGISVDRSVMLKEDTEDLKEALELAEKRSDLIVITGGLGPGKNDITKKTLSEYLNVPLVLDNETQNRIISYHQNSGLTMPEYNQLQAMILMNSTLLENVTGLAAGFLYTQENTTYILLPGPFDELKPMFLEKAYPLIVKEVLNQPIIKTKKYSVYGLTLSQLNDRLDSLIQYEKNPFVGIYFEKDEAKIQITARASTEDKAEKLLNETAKKVKECIGDYIYGEDEKHLTHIVKQLLKEQGKTITAAESLTGGSFLDVISSEPESSEIFEGGIVTYSEQIKHHVLKVSTETLEKHGVVSAQCAIEMAENARQLFNADLAISLTGVAGPSSLEGELPGTVWIGLAQKGKETFAKKFHFGYKRDRNRRNSVLSALNMTRLALLEKPIKDQVFLETKEKH